MREIMQIMIQLRRYEKSYKAKNFYKGDLENEKWKKLLLPAMCVFMLQTPVIANAEATGSSDGAAAVVEDPVAAPTPALLNGIIKKGSKTYYYKDGVMQKNCWSTDKKQYFGKNGVAYAAPKESGYKKNVVVKKIGKSTMDLTEMDIKQKKVYMQKGTPLLLLIRMVYV